MNHSGARWSRFLPLLLILAGLLLAYLLGLHRHLSLGELAERRADLREAVTARPVVLAIAFVLAYALATALMFPGAALLTLVGGFLFGCPLGAALAVCGATAGATVLFFAARSALADVLQNRAEGVIRRFADGFRQDAFTYLLVLRLTPVVPFTAINVAAAALDVSPRVFVLATLIGIVPGSAVFAFLGSGLDATLQAIAERGASPSPGDLLTPTAAAALASLCALSLLGLVLKKWLARREPGPRLEATAPRDV